MIKMEGILMLQNIDQIQLQKLYDRDPEAQLIVETLLDNHKRIMGTVGHEIRNPLSWIYSNIQLIQQKHPNLMIDPLWQSLFHDTIFMKEVLEDLSSFNNASSLKLSEVDITTLLKTTVLSFASSILDDDISLTSTIPELKPMYLDATKIRQVIINLLKNAKEACSADGRIDFFAKQDNQKLTLTFQDNGCGISDSILTEIFKPFHTYKTGGTGLGLPICQEIIHAHEGSITVHSDLNNGTTFTLSIPFL